MSTWFLRRLIVRLKMTLFSFERPRYPVDAALVIREARLRAHLEICIVIEK